MYVVLCNCPPQVSVDIARQLVAEGLAACVNIIPGVRSIYRWEGAIAEDDEHTLLIKVAEDGFEKLRDRVQTLHPYDVPEIVALRVANVNDAYLRWIQGSG